MKERGGSSDSGLFHRVWSKMTASQDTLEANELQEDVQQAGALAIAECQDRERVTLSGSLRAVGVRPRAGSPTLEADLYDGSGMVTLIWVGRRRIPGIDPGRGIVVTGRVACRNEKRYMYNPRYSLRPSDAS